MGYKPGEDVLKEEPFAYIVKKEFQNSVCDFCLKPHHDDEPSDVTLKRCANCKSYLSVLYILVRLSGYSNKSYLSCLFSCKQVQTVTVPS